MFYYERRDERGSGPYLMFGKKGKTVNNVLEMGAGAEIGNSGSAVLIAKVAGSNRKIRINTKN